MTKGLLLFIVATFLVNSISAQLPPVQQQAIVLKRQIEKNHYSPRAVDDSFSYRVFTLFIQQLDNGKDLFTEDEYNSLAKNKYSIDDELNRREWKLLPLASQIYKRSLLRVDSLVKSILQKPLDFNADEKLQFTRKDKVAFQKDIAGLRSKWTRWIKYIMLSRAYSIAHSDSIKKSLADVLQKNESQIREQIAKGQAKLFSSLLEDFDESMRKSYLNAIATTFDPHTNYFSPQQQEKFQAELSTQEFSYGFEVDQNKEGKIVVAMLIPGGPAWKTGEIHQDDEILQLQKKGKPAIDISAISIEEVDEILNGTDHDELTVKVRKTNGSIKTVVLKKEKIEVEENVIKGYLLTGAKNIGYITLPGFFTTWENETGSGCANEVAKEIIKMKKENLDGLIIDLRFNGGGSMYEALQLCGIFIDEGPMVGVKRRDGKLLFDKDPNRGTIYDGPLVIMINNQSASASEMVSATMQDYNRAVIVGSPSFGKATMQQVFPMDTNSVKMTRSPDGFVKITIGKFYRLNGETTQWNGVIPDIVLPDAYDGLEYSEKYMPNALFPDTARKNSSYKSLSPLPIAALSTSSKKRVSNDPSFRNLEQSIERRKIEIAGNGIIPLRAAEFEKWMKDREEGDEVGTESKIYRAGNYKMEIERISGNSYAREINEAVLKGLQNDMYIQEAYLVMSDLISLIKK